MSPNSLTAALQTALGSTLKTLMLASDVIFDGSGFATGIATTRIGPTPTLRGTGNITSAFINSKKAITKIATSTRSFYTTVTAGWQRTLFAVGVTPTIPTGTVSSIIIPTGGGSANRIGLDAAGANWWGPSNAMYVNGVATRVATSGQLAVYVSTYASSDDTELNCAGWTSSSLYSWNAPILCWGSCDTAISAGTVLSISQILARYSNLVI